MGASNDVQAELALLSRRRFLQATGWGMGGLAVGVPFLSACSAGAGSTTASAAGSSGTITIGFVSPITGADAAFGESDGFVIALARKAFAKGLVIGGKTYDVKIVQQDGQSNPQRGSQVAQDLINGSHIDLMLTTSTPETVNPVSDACEAAGVPCVSTIVPWEAWYYGRGATPAQTDAYKYTYHFSFGVQEFFDAYTHMWPQVSTNERVGVMWPNDSDGNAIRTALGPELKKAGYTINDPGAYPDGTNDYSSQIALFKSSDSEVFNTFPIPSDFVTFWQQADQQGFKPKIAQTAKTGLFPSQIAALGPLGYGLAGGAYWTPTYPYSSSLTGYSSSQLASMYEASSGQQWSQQIGASLALFDVAAAALKASGNPKDKLGVAQTIAGLAVDTPVGHLAWGTGPVKNVVATPILGGQWVKSTTAKYQFDFVICENYADPTIPVAGQLTSYV